MLFLVYVGEKKDEEKRVNFNTYESACEYADKVADTGIAVSVWTPQKMIFSLKVYKG